MSQILRAAGLMGLATFISRICGLVREQVFAYLFGAGVATDAFNIAFRIPNLLRDLFAEGAMSSAFIPTFVRVRSERGERDAWRVAGLVFRVLGWGVSIITVIGIVSAPWLVNLYASAFHAVPGKFELTVKLTRQIFPYFPLVALSAAFMGVLNACQAFFIPAFSSALFNIVSILVGVALTWVMPKFGRHPIEGMAIGVVAGGIAQAFSQLPLLYKKGYFWPKREIKDPDWHQDPDLRRMLILLVPGTLGLAATQINILVNSMLATSAGTGAVSWLNYAFRLMQFPIGVFGVSFATATLPLFSRHWVGRDYGQAVSSVRESLRQVIAINLPASAGLAFLSVPIIAMIFQHGRFSALDTQSTARALVAYSIGLTAYSAVKVLAPVFYAMENTKIPVISSALSVFLNLGLNLLMVKRFGFWGLALGTSITAVLNGLFLLIAFERMMAPRTEHRLGLLKLSRFTFGVLLISCVMGSAVLFLYRQMELFLPNSLSNHLLSRVILTFSVVVFGALLIVWAGKLFKIPEMSTPVETLFRKALKKLGWEISK